MKKIHNYKKIPFSFFTFSILFLSLNSVDILKNSAYAQVRNNRGNGEPLELIYKFKDNSGSAVYSDRLPSGQRGEFTVLSARSGMIKKVVEEELNQEQIEELKREKEEEKIKAEEQKNSASRDKALLIAYSSVEDIDKLRDYELEQIDLGIKNNIDSIATLKDRIKNLEESYNLNPNNNSLKLDLEKSQNDLQIIQKTLDSNKEMYAQREQKYLEDKKRYLEIMEEKKQQHEQEDAEMKEEVEKAGVLASEKN